MPIVDASRPTRVLWLASAVCVVLCVATLILHLADRLGPFTLAMIVTYALLAILIVVLTEVTDVGSGVGARVRCVRRATGLRSRPAVRAHTSREGARPRATRRCRLGSEPRCTRPQREDMS
jgi:hypothetical protein